MCGSHQTQLCRVLPGPQFRMGKWPWKHPAENLATPLELKENLQSSCQKEKESNKPRPSTYYYLFFFLTHLVPELQRWVLTEHVSFLFNSFSAKSIDCGHTTSLAVQTKLLDLALKQIKSILLLSFVIKAGGIVTTKIWEVSETTKAAFT